MNSICSLYEIDYEQLRRYIADNKRVLIIAPNGLKKLYKCISDRYPDLLDKVIFSSSPSYGSCDLPLSEIYTLKPDIIIHIGHSDYPWKSYSLGVRILYVPAYYAKKPSRDELLIIKNTLEKTGISRIAIVATIQHIKIIDRIKEYLQENGFMVEIGEASFNTMAPGQVLGCEYSSLVKVKDKIDAVLVVAGGYFHALGAYLVSGKPVYIYDPYRGVVEDYTREAYRVLAKRYYLVEKIRTGLYRSVGLIIGSTPGQYRPSLIDYLYRRSVEKGFKPYIISSHYLDKDRLTSIDNGFNLDFYVITSCPRLPIDDLSDFYKPVLTPGEYIMVLNNVKNYVFPW